MRGYREKPTIKNRSEGLTKIRGIWCGGTKGCETEEGDTRGRDDLILEGSGNTSVPIVAEIKKLRGTKGLQRRDLRKDISNEL